MRFFAATLGEEMLRLRTPCFAVLEPLSVFEVEVGSGVMCDYMLLHETAT